MNSLNIPSLKTLILFIGIGFSAIQGVYAQDIMKKQISEDIKNKSMLEVLELLEAKHHIKFSYDSKLVNKSTLFTSNAKNVTLNDFLLAMLKEVNLNYRLINNHIVLYYYKWPEEDEGVRKKANQIPKKDIKSQGQRIEPEEDRIIVYDTIVYTINDTVIHTVYDTSYIQLIDTLIVYDTVRLVIEPEQPEEKLKGNREKRPIKEAPKYALGVQAGLIYPIAEIMPYGFTVLGSDLSNNTSTFSYKPSWNAGFTFDEYFKRAFIQTGINVCALRREISLNAVRSTIVPNTEISDSYYEISNGDTTWFDIIEDDFVINIDTLRGNIATEQAYYLEIPVSLGYDFALTRSLSLGVMAGAKGSILLAQKLRSDVQVIPNEVHQVVNMNFSVTGGVRLTYQLQNNLRISTKAEYIKSIKHSYNHITFSLSLSKAFY